LGSRGACLLQPYNDRAGHSGFLLHSITYMQEQAQLVNEKGFQLNTHCIGDSACRTVLNIYGKVLGNDNDRRWRIEHAQHVDPADFQLFGKYNIIPSMQPTHATSDMYWVEERLGKKRLSGAYALKALMEENKMIALGSDFPIESINPVLGFYAAVTRKDLNNFPDQGFETQNKLSREQALRGMTIWAAYANFEEQEKGSLEKGKVADFVILDNDIMKMEEKQIPHVKVISTYLNGEKVY